MSTADGNRKRCNDVKKIRSYSSIWSVEKVIYAINDMRLPFPITFSQMAWFVACEFAVLALGGLPPLSMIDGALLKYFGIPVGVTWFMSQKTWDGKKPFSFVKSYTAYLLRPKQTFAGKAVKFRKEKTGQPITAVRSVIIDAVSSSRPFCITVSSTLQRYEAFSLLLFVKSSVRTIASFPSESSMMHAPL